MTRGRSHPLIAKSLVCILLLLIPIYVQLEGHARFTGAGPEKAGKKPTPFVTLSPQANRARRKTSRRSRAARAGRTYINAEGVRVPSPRYNGSAPEGATAQCRDGTYSFSRSRRGTCSHHGGVARWL